MLKKAVYSKEDAFLNADFIKAYIYNTMPFLVRSKNMVSRQQNTQEKDMEYETSSLSEAIEYLSQEAGQAFRVENNLEQASNYLSQEVAGVLSMLDAAGM
jgi:hypothetical protein